VSRIRWPAVVSRAAAIVESYDTPVTLRQLFYRLVAWQVLPNTLDYYKQLSARTAEARRDGGFPALLDRGRAIYRPRYWASPQAAQSWLHREYLLDRTAGQDVSIYLGVEKAAMVVQLQAWFGDLGIPVLPLSGYASQTYTDEVAADVFGQERPAILLYAGDFDPSGEDIDRDFIERSACWDKTVRVALTTSQVRLYGLPVNPGKIKDSRAASFTARHGELVQVELEALDPADLRALFQAAIDGYLDVCPPTRPCSPRSRPTAASWPPRHRPTTPGYPSAACQPDREIRDHCYERIKIVPKACHSCDRGGRRDCWGAACLLPPVPAGPDALCPLRAPDGAQQLALQGHAGDQELL
jgi:hypothetical protein